MSESQAPAIVAALVNLWTAALDVPVYDGPQPFDIHAGAVLFVGHDPDDDGAGISSDLEWAAIGNRRKKEIVEVRSVLSVWTGDEDVAPRRAEAFALFEQVSATHRVDITLGGLCLFSSITNFAARQGNDELGAECRIAFTIRAEARI